MIKQQQQELSKALSRTKQRVLTTERSTPKGVGLS